MRKLCRLYKYCAISRSAPRSKYQQLRSRTTSINQSSCELLSRLSRRCQIIARTSWRHPQWRRRAQARVSQVPRTSRKPSTANSTNTLTTTARANSALYYTRSLPRKETEFSWLSHATAASHPTRVVFVSIYLARTLFSCC